MIGFMGFLLIVGAGLAGGIAFSKHEKRDKDKKEQKLLPEYKKANRTIHGKFPSGKESVSDILLYMMSSEQNGIPQDWMKDVKRLEGDEILSEEVYRLFWEKYNELTNQFHKFDSEVDRYETMSTLSESAFHFYRESMYELKSEIYELAEACYALMRKNEEMVENDYYENVGKIGQEKPEESPVVLAEKTEAELNELPLSIEQEKLWTIYRSKESTPEMKKRALTLLQELESVNGETYVNPKLQDMDLDMETIERIVRGKQIK